MEKLSQLETLVATLEQQELIKHDFIINGSSISFLDGELIVDKRVKDVSYHPTDHFHTQMSEKLNIPKGYYDKMKASAISLLDSNVNHWLNQQSKNLLIRTFEDGKNNQARALLSDRYSMIDNLEVLLETLEALKETGLHVEVEGAELSETKMYLKIVAPEVEVKATEMLKNYRRTIGVGSGIISGFTLQNSEIGMGTFTIMPRAKVLACDNGLVVSKDGLKRVHLGGKMDELDFSKNEEIKANNRRLVKSQVKHAVKQFLSKNYLETLVKKFTEAGAAEIEAPINELFTVIASKYDISEKRKGDLLNYFLKGGESRRIGVVNALTEECQLLTDIDKKNQTEMISMDVLENFKTIEAAAIKISHKAN